MLQAVLERGRRQDALSWEPRSATSLARLSIGRAGPPGAQGVGSLPVYRRFREGFKTADLLAAKALLDALLRAKQPTKFESLISLKTEGLGVAPQS
jgi:predicted ATPase